MEGNHSDLEKIRNIDMDFHKIIPMPESMANDIGHDNLGGQDLEQIKRQGTKEQVALKQSWIDEFGYDGWFAWSCKFWGTKWNASNVKWEDNGDYQTVKFDTAWDRPSLVIKALSKMFPNVTFDLSWSIEGEEPHEEYEKGVEI